MGFRLSTGLRNAMMGTDGFKTALALGKIDVFSGAIPTDADTAEGSGVLLITFTKDGGAFPANGLSLDTPSGGTIEKAVEIWKGTGITVGTATWFRFYGPTVILGASTTAVRLDGLVGTSSSDLILTTISIQSGVPVTIDTAEFRMPSK